MYAVAQGYGMLAGGLAHKALIVGGDVLSKILDWSDRSTAVLFGDGAGAVVLERVADGGFLGFELGADGSGGPQLYLPAGGSRTPASAESVEERQHFVQMNGREVFKFATRVLVSSAEAVLTECGTTDRRRRRLRSRTRRTCASSSMRGRSSGFRRRRRWSTSTATATRRRARSRLRWRMRRPTAGFAQGQLVLMTGMGAGLTWGSGLIEWTAGGEG